MNALLDTIRSLAISVRGPVEAFLTQKCMTSLMIQPFDELVSPYRFPYLQNLELEGWCVELTALQKLPTCSRFNTSVPPSNQHAMLRN